MRPERPGAFRKPLGDSSMKCGRGVMALVAIGATLGSAGCGGGKSSPSTLASDESMPTRGMAQSARPRGLMVAGDTLGRVVFSDSTPAMASVPDRER